jgi:hypothetical protein
MLTSVPGNELQIPASIAEYDRLSLDRSCCSPDLDSMDWLSLLKENTLDRVLALLAIGFATKQFIDARKTARTMDAHSNYMKELGKSMSTRFIGTFPTNCRK